MSRYGTLPLVWSIMCYCYVYFAYQTQCCVQKLGYTICIAFNVKVALGYTESHIETTILHAISYQNGDFLTKFPFVGLELFSSVASFHAQFVFMCFLPVSSSQWGILRLTSWSFLRIVTQRQQFFPYDF